MATVTGLTAERMLEIEAASVVDGDVIAGNLILTKHDGNQINAGSVVGPAGPQGPAGVAIVAIPGEIRMWSGATLPDSVKYGVWAWANGDIYDISAYPEAAANIDDAWNTAMGLAAPAAGKFRVPDLRGLTPAGLDAMPVGAARANRLTRAQAIILAKNTGEEVHKLVTAEIPSHAHNLNSHTHTLAHTHTMNHDHPIQIGDTTSGWVQGSTRVAGTDVSMPVVDRGGGGAGAPVKMFNGSTGAASVGTTSTPSNNNSGSAGSDGNHENVQPTIFVPYIVKLDG